MVLLSGNAVEMPWVKQVPALIQGWYLGSEGGNALANVLSGKTNPSGKLPFSFPVKLTDIGAHAFDELSYPGDSIRQVYKEDIFVGYRWLEKQKLKPLFSFGHGLSYTSFEYGKPFADKKEIKADENITFKVKVKNSGNRAGKEVVQLYIKDKKSSLPRPLKELKAFEKISLAPGEEKEVTFTIDKSALSFYDDAKQAWTAEAGDFEALIGASASDIRAVVPFKLK